MQFYESKRHKQKKHASDFASLKICFELNWVVDYDGDNDVVLLRFIFFLLWLQKMIIMMMSMMLKKHDYEDTAAVAADTIISAQAKEEQVHV